MLWPRFRRAPISAQSAPVPDAEALRRAALQASWRRDRWVGRRRVALRWTAWALRHYILPAGLVLGFVLWLGLQAVPYVYQRLTGDTAAAAPAPLQTPEPAPILLPTEPAPQTADSLSLRLDPRFNETMASSPPSAPGPDADTTPTPDLKPENWLHSKEP